MQQCWPKTPKHGYFTSSLLLSTCRLTTRSMLCLLDSMQSYALYTLCNRLKPPGQTPRTRSSFLTGLAMCYLDGYHASLLADGQTCMPRTWDLASSRGDGGHNHLHAIGIAFQCRGQQPHTCVSTGERDTVDKSMAGQVVSNLASPPCSRHAAHLQQMQVG